MMRRMEIETLLFFGRCIRCERDSEHLSEWHSGVRMLLSRPDMMPQLTLAVYECIRDWEHADDEAKQLLLEDCLDLQACCLAALDYERIPPTIEELLRVEEDLATFIEGREGWHECHECHE